MLPRGINQFAALGQDQTIEQFQLAEILLYKCCIIEDVILLKGQWMVSGKRLGKHGGGRNGGGEKLRRGETEEGRN